MVNPGEPIGFVDVMNARNYTSSMKCTSNFGICYVADAFEFF